MLVKILIGIAVLVGGILVAAALQPKEFHFARETKINASPEAIFPYVNNMKKMDTWNPWMKLDDKIKITNSGPDDGVGSKTNWEGSSQVGTGSATIVESTPSSHVKVELAYKKPFEGTQHAEFQLKPEGNQTTVVWSVGGPAPLINRIFCLFMNMDKMMGETFERGLSDLKKLAEASK